MRTFSKIAAMCTLFAGQAFAQSADIEHWDDSAYAGNGVVEWRVHMRNNGASRICCRIEMTGARFSYGNRRIVSDSQFLCVYPGRETYAALLGVTTHIGTSNTWGEKAPQGTPWKSPQNVDISVASTTGQNKYRIFDCR